MFHKKYTLERPKLLVVDSNVHALVKQYALKQNITIVEATYILLQKAFAEENLKEKNDHNNTEIRNKNKID